MPGGGQASRRHPRERGGLVPTRLPVTPRTEVTPTRWGTGLLCLRVQYPKSPCFLPSGRRLGRRIRVSELNAPQARHSAGPPAFGDPTQRPVHAWVRGMRCRPRAGRWPVRRRVGFRTMPRTAPAEGQPSSRMAASLDPSTMPFRWCSNTPSCRLPLSAPDDPHCPPPHAPSGRDGRLCRPRKAC